MDVDLDNAVVACGPWNGSTVLLTVDALDTAVGPHTLTVSVASQGDPGVSEVIKVRIQVLPREKKKVPDGPDNNFLGTYGMYIIAAVVATVIAIVVVVYIYMLKAKRPRED
jgi:ABC-type phosphate transport system permease subunit